MKLSTREDIEAPIAYVFDQVTDFAALERRAIRQGAEVVRRAGGPVTAGAEWDISFEFRGRCRQVAAKLTVLDPPNTVCFDSGSDGIAALTQINLVALSQTRTRVLVSFEMQAKTFTARVLLQSLKLAKSKMSQRFAVRVKDYADNIEDGFLRDA